MIGVYFYACQRNQPFSRLIQGVHFFFKQKHCSAQEKMVLSHADTLCMSFKKSRNLLLCDPIFSVTIVKPVLSDHSKRRPWFSQICPGPK